MIRKRIIHRILKKFFEAYHNGERDKRDKYAAAIISGVAWTPEEKAYINMRKTVTDSTNLTWNDIKQYAKEHEARRENKTPVLDALDSWQYTQSLEYNRHLVAQQQWFLNNNLATMPATGQLSPFRYDDEEEHTIEPSV